ncbi:MAG: ABC transporter ATP-binding protein [Desulfobacula sp.]|nr:ABC transporter ATP-binding protein [Desulfobacula sp.]
MDKALTPLISLCNISKSFSSSASKIEILKKTDFEIFQGETIAVIGSSGIGKSTLLNIIGTLDKPDSGDFFFKNHDLALYNDKELANFRNLKIGFVFQFHYLLQGFSALENVMIPELIALNQKITHKNKKKVENNALNMLERVGMSSRISHRVEQLSGGEQQRVALARALVMKPAILLADEPTGNLDRANSDSVHGLIDELNREIGMTVIVVTHNNKLARMMKRNVTIKKGKIIPA